MNKYVLGAIIAGLIFLVVLFVTPLIRFRPWFKWWKDHQPPGNNNQRCVPMALLAYQSSAAFLYDIANLFLVTENQIFDYNWQAEFLLDIMNRWAVDIPNKGDGFLTPYGLCHSICPQKGDTNFTEKPSYTGKDGETLSDWPQNLTDAQRKRNPSQELLWQAIFASWGCKPDPQQPDQIAQDTGNLWTTQKSNFLWRMYAIPIDSDLCGAFVCGTETNSKGEHWYPLALKTLLGIDTNSGAGGWVGFLRSGGDWGDYGLDNMAAYVWSHDPGKKPDPNSPLTNCGAAGWASAGSSGLSMGIAGAFAGSAVAPGIGTVIGFLAGFFGGGALGAVQYKCHL